MKIIILFDLEGTLITSYQLEERYMITPNITAIKNWFDFKFRKRQVIQIGIYSHAISTNEEVSESIRLGNTIMDMMGIAKKVSTSISITDIFNTHKKIFPTIKIDCPDDDYEMFSLLYGDKRTSLLQLGHELCKGYDYVYLVDDSFEPCIIQLKDMTIEIVKVNDGEIKTI